MAATALLTGCGMLAPGPAVEATSSATVLPIETQVDAKDLGAALERLVYHDTGQSSSSDRGEGGGLCLVKAVQKSGLSAEAQAYIVESKSDHLGALVEGMRGMPDSAADVEALLSRSLRSQIEACMDADLPAVDQEPTAAPSLPAAPSTAPASSASSAAPTPDLKPRFEIKADVDILAARELMPGVVAVFSSYVLDDDQAQVYEAAGECLARAVFDAGFSQETLRFLAGGPALGVGAVADHLPAAVDRALWRSPGFRAELALCTTAAELGS